MKTAGHASPAEFFTALKFQNSAVAFPKENHSHEGCVAGTTFVSAKGALPRELGKQGATEMRGQHGSKIALPNTLLPSLPILSRRRHIICCRYGLALPPEIPRRSAKGDSETLVRMRIVTHKKRPAARQDVSLREISAGDESALLQEPAADFQTGFFPDWPRSARPSARSPSDCSGRSGSRKNCRGRRPAQGRAP